MLSPLLGSHKTYVWGKELIRMSRKIYVLYSSGSQPRGRDPSGGREMLLGGREMMLKKKKIVLWSTFVLRLSKIILIHIYM